MNGQRGAAGILALLLLLVGCGGGSETVSPEALAEGEPCGLQQPSPEEVEDCTEMEELNEPEGTKASEVEPGEAVTPPEPEEVGGPLRDVTTLHLESEAGYKAKVVLRRGELVRATGSARSGDLTLGTTCSVNGETDAALPFELAVTNTTHGYADEPDINIIAVVPGWIELEVVPPAPQAEIGYTAGPECVEFTYEASPFFEDGEYLGFGPTDPLEPGNFVQADGFFVIPDYYSPKHPDGDPAKFQSVFLNLVPALTQDPFSITSASGVSDSPTGVDGTVEYASIPLLPDGGG